ncbi:MAG: sulfotransferase, partial [Anaerolineales bacterium]
MEPAGVTTKNGGRRRANSGEPVLVSKGGLYLRLAPMALWRRMVSHTLLEGRPLTTRGRWANPLILAQLRSATKIVPPRPVHQPIFILGSGRSGTTILGDLLGSHRQAAFLNEPKALWYVANPQDDVIGTYTTDRGCYRLTESQADGEIRRRIHSLYRYALGLCMASRIVDKYPEMIYRTDFLRALFTDPKFVIIVRNGWDTIRSIQDWSLRHRVDRDKGREDWWGANQRKWRLLKQEIVSQDPPLAGALAEAGERLSDESMAAVEWVSVMREASRLRANGVPLQVVYYEKLTSQPAAVLSEICDHADLPDDPGLYEYARRAIRSRRRRSKPALPAALAALVDRTMEEWG